MVLAGIVGASLAAAENERFICLPDAAIAFDRDLKPVTVTVDRQWIIEPTDWSIFGPENKLPPPELKEFLPLQIKEVELLDDRLADFCTVDRLGVGISKIQCFGGAMNAVNEATFATEAAGLSFLDAERQDEVQEEWDKQFLTITERMSQRYEADFIVRLENGNYRFVRMDRKAMFLQTEAYDGGEPYIQGTCKRF